MVWDIVYLVIAILAGIAGIWNLARQRNVFLSLAGILWFLVVLFRLYIPRVYNYVIADGVPAIGSMVLFILIPVCMIFAFITPGRR